MAARTVMHSMRALACPRALRTEAAHHERRHSHTGKTAGSAEVLRPSAFMAGIARLIAAARMDLAAMLARASFMTAPTMFAPVPPVRSATMISEGVVRSVPDMPVASVTPVAPFVVMPSGMSGMKSVAPAAPTVCAARMTGMSVPSVPHGERGTSPPTSIGVACPMAATVMGRSSASAPCMPSVMANGTTMTGVASAVTAMTGEGLAMMTAALMSDMTVACVTCAPGMSAMAPVMAVAALMAAMPCEGKGGASTASPLSSVQRGAEVMRSGKTLAAGAPAAHTEPMRRAGRTSAGALVLLLALPPSAVMMTGAAMPRGVVIVTLRAGFVGFRSTGLRRALT